MINFELAKILKAIAHLLEMEEVPFKPQAFGKAARTVESLPQDIREIATQKELKDLPDIGESIASDIIEYIKTGKIKRYEKLKKKYPMDVEGIMAVEGIGPKMILDFYRKLEIKTLDQLEKAARKHKIRKLPGYREKTEENILKGIKFLKRTKARFLLGQILPVVEDIKKRIASQKEVKRLAIAGSIRRMKETIGDLDMLATSSHPEKVMDFFVKLPEVIKVWSKGKTRSSVRTRAGFDMDLRVVEDKCFGAALQYFTGNKEHNIEVRTLAEKKGYKLNEYGLFRGKKKLAARTEKTVYQKLGLPYFEPEIRLGRGEVEAALYDKLPEIVEYDEILADLQIHTDWSDGTVEISEMAKAAKALGRKYILITDHAGNLKIARGMKEKRLLKYMAEIDRANKKISGIKILKGAEVDINPNGALAIKDKVLSQLDIVLAAVHSRFKMGKKEMTQRMIRAIENPHIDIISHPTGRIIQKREGYDLNLEKIYQAAARTKTALEINAYPGRLDLNDYKIRAGLKYKVKYSIGTDAHAPDQLQYLRLGTGQARRGWATKKDIVNTKTASELLKYFKQ